MTKQNIKIMSGEILLAFHKKDWRSILQLLERGESVDIYHESLGAPILSLAIQNEWRDLAYYLIHNGANVNAKSVDSWSTPLIYAALNADLDMIKLLIENGAKISQSSKKGMTARMCYVGMYGESNNEILEILTPGNP